MKWDWIKLWLIEFSEIHPQKTVDTFNVDMNHVVTWDDSSDHESIPLCSSIHVTLE